MKTFFQRKFLQIITLILILVFLINSKSVAQRFYINSIKGKYGVYDSLNKKFAIEPQYFYLQKGGKETNTEQSKNIFLGTKKQGDKEGDFFELPNSGKTKTIIKYDWVEPFEMDTYYNSHCLIGHYKGSEKVFVLCESRQGNDTVIKDIDQFFWPKLDHFSKGASFPLVSTFLFVKNNHWFILDHNKIADSSDYTLLYYYGEFLIQKNDSNGIYKFNHYAQPFNNKNIFVPQLTGHLDTIKSKIGVGLMNRYAKVLIESKYDSVKPLKSLILFYKNGKVGLKVTLENYFSYNEVPAVYDSIHLLNQHECYVSAELFENGKNSFYKNSLGILPLSNDSITAVKNIENDLYALKIHNKWRLMNDGKILNNEYYDDVQINGMIVHLKINNKWASVQINEDEFKYNRCGSWQGDKIKRAILNKKIVHDKQKKYSYDLSHYFVWDSINSLLLNKYFLFAQAWTGKRFQIVRDDGTGIFVSKKYFNAIEFKNDNFYLLTKKYLLFKKKYKFYVGNRKYKKLKVQDFLIKPIRRKEYNAIIIKS